MALSQSQLNNLVSLFSTTAIQEPLTNFIEKFSHYFGKQDHYKVGTALLKLFQYDTSISTRSEFRLLSIFLFLELYKSEEITRHPFLGIFRRLLGRVNSFRTEQPIVNSEAHYTSIFSLNQFMKNGQTSQQPDKFSTNVFNYDVFCNSTLPILSAVEQNILKSLILEKLGIKTQFSRSFLMKKSIKTLLDPESPDQVKCGINVDLETLDTALIERSSRLNSSIQSNIDAISCKEHKKAGFSFDFLQAQEELRREKTILSENSIEENKPTVVNQALLDKLLNPSTPKTFKPTIRCPAPPINFLIEDELAWLDIDEISAGIHDFEYDFTSKDEWSDYLCPLPKKTKKKIDSLTSQLKEKLTLAQVEVLEPEKRDEIQEHLECLGKINQEQVQSGGDTKQSGVHPNEFGLSPSHFSKFIDLNPIVAVHILVYLAKNNYIMKEYLGILVEYKSNALHSMEVVNRLTSLVVLPPEFLNLYISQCIDNCEKNEDSTQQKRLVRLVCVFIQSLLSNKIITNNQEGGKDVFAIIEEFCVSYPNYKESTALFKQIRKVVAESK